MCVIIYLFAYSLVSLIVHLFVCFDICSFTNSYLFACLLFK